MVVLNVVSNALFGPAYTHLTFPVWSHLIGSEVANAYIGNDNPDGRIVDTVPLIMNTMGWTKGLGADLMQQIEEVVEPNEIFEFHDESGFSYSNQKQVAIPNAGDRSLHNVNLILFSCHFSLHTKTNK
jgi:polynucleotide 5'-hydroxyl-kinase GRC3/NOL9